ncbi:MAG: class I SAM-dependent methyltransferase [Nostoc sp.]|uniref:class I SAM-dependent methyltransferase n=1 Tax=Nostoc sp. TaxID=1180 RepID=UPI002FF3B5E2
MSPSRIQLKDQLTTSEYFIELITMAYSSPEGNALLQLIKTENIFGWGTDRECLLQYALGRWGSQTGVIVEIGSFKGRSTICFAKGVKDGNRECVVAIDPHTGAPPWFPAIPSAFTLKEFEENLNVADVKSNVMTFVTDSFQAARIWPALSIRVLFLDGDHSYEGLLADYEQWIEKLVVGGVLLIDDVDDPIHLPGIIRFIETVITHEGFSDITIIDGILVAIKKDIGVIGHLNHLQECLKDDSNYTALWNERHKLEIALERFYVNKSALTELSNNHSNGNPIDSVNPTNFLSPSERELISNFYIYNRSLAVTALTISQDTSESLAIFRDATKSVHGGKVQEIRLYEQNWISQIEETAQSWQSLPIRLLYLDLPDYNALDQILNMWKIKLAKYAVILVHNNYGYHIPKIMHELQLFPFQGMGYLENIYWTISMVSNEEKMLELQYENYKFKDEISQLNKTHSELKDEILAMKTSKFWKIREKWFYFKEFFSS